MRDKPDGTDSKEANAEGFLAEHVGQMGHAPTTSEIHPPWHDRLTQEFLGSINTPQCDIGFSNYSPEA